MPMEKSCSIRVIASSTRHRVPGAQITGTNCDQGCRRGGEEMFFFFTAETWDASEPWNTGAHAIEPRW